MSMRDDLDDITALAVDVKGVGGLDSRFAEFLRDHGPALLEAVRDAERYRWLMEHATMEAPFGAVTMKTVPPDNPQHTKTLWDGLIDAARGDA